MALMDGGVLLAAAGAPCCCGPGTPTRYYWARRCDVVYPPPVPLPIPEGVPSDILIPVPFGCAGEACEIEGLRVVAYRGYCYIVVEDDQESEVPGCEGRLLALRVRIEDMGDPPPPVVDPAEIICKDPGAECVQSDCIPVAPPGSCCLPSFDDECNPDDPRGECNPCECPRFARYLFVMQWVVEADTWGPLFDGGEHTGRLRTNGTITLLADCTSGVPVYTPGGAYSYSLRHFVIGQEIYDVEYSGPPSDDAGPVSVAGGLNEPREFGRVPANALLNLSASVSIFDGTAATGCSPCTTYGVWSSGCECVDDNGAPGNSCEGPSTTSASASCWGGEFTHSGETGSEFEPGHVRHRYQGTYRWWYIPLLRCTDDDGFAASGLRAARSEGTMSLIRRAMRLGVR